MSWQKDDMIRHKNGCIYKIIMLTNELTEKPLEYPITVVYQNVHNNTLWSRPLKDMDRSFVKIVAGEPYER